MTAKEYMKQIKKIDTMIDNKKAELSQASKILPIKCIEDDITELFTSKQNIIKLIERLPEAEYDVLHRTYVQNKTLQEIADDRGISYSLVTTLHGRALKLLENILRSEKIID